MKNKNLNKIIISLSIVLMTAMPAFALKAASAPSAKMIATKFGIAMGGVMLFSIILYVGLSLYNRFFVDDQIKDFKLRKDSLRTPSDKDEAVMMFIAKNRLR